jgi:hypothetical protein
MFLVDPACTVDDVFKLLRRIPPMLEAAGLAVPAAASGHVDTAVSMASEAGAACTAAADAGAGNAGFAPAAAAAGEGDVGAARPAAAPGPVDTDVDMASTAGAACTAAAAAGAGDAGFAPDAPAAGEEDVGAARPAAAPGPDVDIASEAVAACPAAAAAGAADDAAPRGPWLGVRIFEVSPGIFVNERGEQCDAYLRLFISFTPTSEKCAAHKIVDFQ